MQELQKVAFENRFKGSYALLKISTSLNKYQKEATMAIKHTMND